MGVGHVHGRALVTHIDDRYAGLSEKVPDRLDVTALQTEYTLHTATDQTFGNPGRHALAVGIEVFVDAGGRGFFIGPLFARRGLGNGDVPVEERTRFAVRDFAGGVAGHLVRRQETHLPRALEAGKPVARPVDQTPSRKIGAG